MTFLSLGLILTLSGVLALAYAAPEVQLGSTTLVGRDVTLSKQDFFGGRSALRRFVCSQLKCQLFEPYHMQNHLWVHYDSSLRYPLRPRKLAPHSMRATLDPHVCKRLELVTTASFFVRTDWNA